MIELCCEYLFVQYIWLYVIIMSCNRSRSEYTLCSCLNVKELLTQNRRHIWSLSNSNGTRTHNHLFREQALNHSAKLAKWLSYVVSTDLYCLFDCMLLLFGIITFSLSINKDTIWHNITYMISTRKTDILCPIYITIKWYQTKDKVKCQH